MSSNYTSTVKVTNNYDDGNYGKYSAPSKPTKVYICPDERSHQVRFDSASSNGFSMMENERDSPVGVDRTSFSKGYSDYKEDYEPDYKRNENIYWRDPDREAKLKKDFYINHKKMSEADYNKYLDSENIREKSLLNRISVEEDLKDKPREYYRKPSKTVSEIFSKKSNGTNSLTRPQRVKTDSLPRESLDFKYSLSELSDGTPYQSVYQDRYGSMRRQNGKDENKKTEVSFADFKKPDKTESPTRKLSNSVYDYKLPSYYRQNTDEDKRKTSITDSYLSREQREIKPLYVSKFTSKPSEPSITIPTVLPVINAKPQDDSLSSLKSLDYDEPYSPSKYKYDYKSKNYDDVFLPENDSPRNKVSFSDNHSPIVNQDKKYENGARLDHSTGYADDEKDNRNVNLMNMYYSKDGRLEEYDGPPPRRIPWIQNPRGVVINLKVDGQPCDDCPGKCTGFKQHSWRHTSCPLWQGYDKEPEIPWKGLQFACLNVLHLYCKVFDKEEVFDMVVRKTCQSCKCPRESHSVYQEEYSDVRARLGLVAPSHWSPPGLPPVKAEAFLRASGAGNLVDRSKRLEKQLPRQDLAAAHCRHLEPKHKASYEDFIAARNEIALDIGYAKENHGGPKDCPTCQLPVKSGELGVVATRLGDETMFHPACFVCKKCEELLADLAYCALDDHPYCERHYAEMLKPRCASCDEDKHHRTSSS